MPSATLLVLQPDGSPREHSLAAAELLLGRDDDCDVVVPSRLVSRHHARISRAGAGYTLEDLASHNGTTLNGRRLDAPQPLHDGDRISLGGTGELIFLDGDATSTRPTPRTVGVVLDPVSQEVWVDGRRLSPPLSPAQYSLLNLLTARIGQVCSRDEIVAAVWPEAAGGVSDEALDALIKRVRARLAEAPGGESQLVTVRARGLMLRPA